MQIEPVGECNLRCRMCPVRYRDASNAYMSWHDFTQVIDDLPALAELHLQGLGEPMLHPRFFDMVEYAVARGVAVSVNTNLTLLTPAKAERAATCGLHAIFVSVDGATAETYERIRVDARFDRVERNVERLMDALTRHRSATRVQLVAVAMRENLDELPALVELTARWGIGALSVQHLCHDYGESTLPVQYAPMRDFVEQQTLVGFDALRVRRSFNAARRTALRHGIDLRLPQVSPRVHPAGTPGRTRCDWPWRGPYVAYDGTAMPCCMVATPDRASLGNVVREGVEAVWTGAAYEDFRKQLDSDDPPEICKSCSVYSHVF